MAVAPAAAAPMPKPTIPCSESGVLKTRRAPKRGARPAVQRKTPPNATSSPKTSVLIFDDEFFEVEIQERFFILLVEEF